jgi:hypothetical protein
MSDIARICARLAEEGLDQGDLAKALAGVKADNPRYSQLGVSAPTISRKGANPKYTLRTRSLEYSLYEEALKRLKVLKPENTLDVFLSQLRENPLISKALAENALRKRNAVDFGNVSHLFGVWQTITFSTYVDANSKYAEIPEDQVRFGLRLIAPHKVATPQRLRLRVCDIGPGTRWDGSGDINAGSIFIRLREVSAGGPYAGERMYLIMAEPTAPEARDQRQDGTFVVYGTTTTVVQTSRVADSHVVFTVTAMRYLPILSDLYLPERSSIEWVANDEDADRFFFNRTKLAFDYCLREPVAYILEQEAGNKYQLERFVGIKEILENISKHSAITRYGPTCAVNIEALG